MPIAMTTKKKQYRNQPAIVNGPFKNNMMYFYMSVAPWRDERLNRNQKAILGQILSHYLEGDDPYIINKKPILDQLGFNPNNKNKHWNGLVELGYLKYEKIGSGGRWIIDETKAKDSKWYKKHHPSLEFTKEDFEQLNTKTTDMGVENEGAENKGLENNGAQINGLISSKGKEEQYKEASNEEIFSFSEESSETDPENLLNVEGGLPDNQEYIQTHDVYGKPLTNEEIMKINNIDYESIPKN